MTHSFHQINIGNGNGHTLGSCIKELEVKLQYIGRTQLQTTVHHICPFQNDLDNTSHNDISRQIFINIICFSFQIMEKFYGRVVVGDVLYRKKNRGGCT